MTDLRTDPVAYWVEAAAAHREHAVKFCKTAAHAQYHESEAVECERKAVKAAAKHAFSDDLPRCDCGHLFEICNYPNCPLGE